MIYYIKNEADGGYSYPGRHKLSKSAIAAIRGLCMKHLFTLDGYLKSVKKILKLKYLVPVVVSNQLAFLYTNAMRDYDNVWINILAVKEMKVSGDKLIFIFDDAHQIDVFMSLNRYHKLKATIFNIFKYKESLV